MTEILVRPHEGKWAAFIEGRPVVRSFCKPCIVKALATYTKLSNKYSAIVILDANGQVVERIKTGAGDGRQTGSDL